jgi:hypothetical protein
MGGVTVASYKSDVGASIGTVPEGEFQIDLAPFKKSTKSLSAWCRKPLEQDKFNKTMDLVIPPAPRCLVKLVILSPLILNLGETLHITHA